jgi:hypothetical protein
MLSFYNFKKVILIFFNQIIFLPVIQVAFEFFNWTSSRQVNPCIIFFIRKKNIDNVRTFFMLKKLTQPAA